MKTTNKLFTTTLAAAAVLLAFSARAQYKPTGDDGITASPKVRQRLNERPALLQKELSSPESRTSPRPVSDGIAASPKVRAQLDERNAVIAAAAHPGPVTASTTRPPNDGIAASPKLREQMLERPAPRQVEIAPVKSAK